MYTIVHICTLHFCAKFLLCILNFCAKFISYTLNFCANFVPCSLNFGAKFQAMGYSEFLCWISAIYLVVICWNKLIVSFTNYDAAITIVYSKWKMVIYYFAIVFIFLHALLKMMLITANEKWLLIILQLFLYFCMLCWKWCWSMYAFICNCSGETCLYTRDFCGKLDKYFYTWFGKSSFVLLFLYSLHYKSVLIETFVCVSKGFGLLFLSNWKKPWQIGWGKLAETREEKTMLLWKWNYRW